MMSSKKRCFFIMVLFFSIPKLCFCVYVGALMPNQLKNFRGKIWVCKKMQLTHRWMVFFLELKQALLIGKAKLSWWKRRHLIYLRVRHSITNPLKSRFCLTMIFRRNIAQPTGQEILLFFRVDCGSNKRQAASVKLFLWCALISLGESTFFCFLPRRHMVWVSMFWAPPQA